ncbi:DoxX family membrane protein [Rhodococcus sp. Z13]|uniref:DoxX family membrane protein n=1 Tax=Rhodococcus sacchari TaxID=2962047 RepID=A0ACD4DLY2_9NOCA|nr:MauE/DoxX family redox-associated membrane protein [Rhodococcus sp. Z13]UYP21051.1 DoxX family membrane protein [Rhodococcus sp. Z13]
MWVRLVSLLARFGLAAVWLISGWSKFSDPSQTVVAVRAYQLLPVDLVRPFAAVFPVAELVLGLLLLVGLAVRPAAIAGALVLVGLIAAIASAWARGLSIDCGCFGGGGVAEGVDGWDYALEIARDLGFLALGVWLAVFPRSPFALGPGSRAPLSATAQPSVAE